MKQRCICPDASAIIKGSDAAPHLSGKVRFYQEQGRVFVVVDLIGLPKDNKTGFFGLHIHEGCTCSGVDFSETGGHYNPSDVAHPNHAGDLSPLMLCQDGAYLALRTDRFHVRDIIGRTVVIHWNSDDLHSQPSGNAGKKIGCGVIQKH